MPYSEIPAFLRALQKKEGVAAKALAFTILTAARSGETRLAPGMNSIWTPLYGLFQASE